MPKPPLTRSPRARQTRLKPLDGHAPAQVSEVEGLAQAPIAPEEASASVASTVAEPMIGQPEPRALHAQQVRMAEPELLRGLHEKAASSGIGNTARKSERKAGRGRQARGVAWEMAAPVLLSGAVLGGGLLNPPRAEAPASVERRALEPVRILPTVAGSQTWTIKPHTAFSFVSLRGQLKRGEIIEGHIARSGQVSRVLVREGQHVDVGDRVLTISTSTSHTRNRTITVPRAVDDQGQAEQQQAQAVRRKEALDERIAQAHTDYAEAQARLDAAKKKLADSRALLKRISLGEQVPDPAAPAAVREPKPRRKRPARSARRRQAAPRTEARVDAAKVESAQSESQAALSALSQAEQEAREASGKVKGLASAASEARSAASAARAEAESARAKLKSVQAQVDAGTAKADVLADARASVSQAESEAADSEKKSAAASEEAQGAVDRARLKASRAGERVAQAQRDLKAASQPRAVRLPATQAEEEPEVQEAVGVQEAPRERARQTRRTLSASAAVRMVRESIAEATAAASNAERLKGRVEGFKNSASDISSDMHVSAQHIEQAQQQVMETTIESSLSTLRAPASGTVLSVASAGEGVDEGQTVVRVAQGPQGLEATLEDRSGAWKQLRAEMTLPGRLLSALPAPPASGVAPGVAWGIETLSMGASPLQGGVPIVLKVRGVEAPTEPGGAARIRVAVIPALSGVEPQSDMGVAIALRKGSSKMLSIPDVAIARGPGRQPLVGVLREIKLPTFNILSAPSSVALAPEGAAPEGVPAVDSPKAPPQVLERAQPRLAAKPEHLFEIEWRPVALSDALPLGALSLGADAEAEPGASASQKMKRVISGLEPGERILRDASEWRGRFVSTPGNPIRVRLVLDIQ